MNNDIRISCSFPEHYKTKKLMAIAGNAAPFSLICLWIYAARNKPDGFLDNMDSFDVEIASNWTGQPNQFFDALVKCKFLTVADEGYYLHDWQVHQPYASSAEERSDKARFAILARHNKALHTKLKEQGITGLSIGEYKEYTKRIRIENDSNTKTYKNVTPSPSPSPLPVPLPIPFPKDNNSPVDKAKKPKEKKADVVFEIPDKLNTPEFLAAWEDWQTYKKQKRKTLTPVSIKKQIEFLASIGVQDAIISINESIRNGYTGLFKVKQAARSNNDNNGFDAIDWLRNA